MTHLFRNSRRQSSTKLFTRRRQFTHERLEPRAMMTVNPTGADMLVNDVVAGFQGIDGNVSSVAVSETAGTLVAYSGTGAGRRESVFLRRYDADGTAQDVVRVSETIRGARTDATVAANDAGSSVVVWHGRGPGDKDGIFMQRFDSAGAKIGSEELVNQTIGGRQYDPSVGMADDGSFVVTWSGPSTADGSGVYARRFNADGTAASDETLVNTTTTGRQTEPSISVNSSGAYVITWTSRDPATDDRDIFAQRFNAAGETQGDEFRVNTTTAGLQQESSVAMQDDGTFMAVWSSLGQDGDDWSVIAQRFDATGTAVGDEIVVNTTTTDQQRHAQIAGAGDRYVVTWQSGVYDGSGWEVMAQEFDSSGTRVGTEQTINNDPSGDNSGHQQHPAVALDADGNGMIVWSGFGLTDRKGVYARNLEDGDTDPGEDNLTPDLAPIEDRLLAPDGELVVVVTATDPNAGDTLTFQLDPDNSPAGATITRNDDDPRSATIRWTPTGTEMASSFTFRVLVTDDGDPPLSDFEEFTVDTSLTLDLNGSGEAGLNSEAPFAIGQGPQRIARDELFIASAGDGMITRSTVVLTETPNGNSEVLAVDTLDTNITATYTPALRRLFLSGLDTSENYERVLRTLTYDNTAVTEPATRTVEVQVNDPGFLSNKPTITINILSAENLVALANELDAANVRFFGAAWSAATAQQRALFEDGGQFLPFNEVTNADRTLNDAVVGPNNITDPDVPVWIFEDGTRLEGVQTIESLAAELGMDVPVSVAPTIVPIEDQTLLVGSPLHVSLDGYDPTGGPLTYTVTTDRPGDVEARILTGNRSARINVEGYGDMVFELFEQRASRATERFIQLASDDLFNDGLNNNDFFYDDVIFHRVIDDFVIQGGDPDGTGTGGTGTDFDDQFHVDLQHNRTGLLSFAKSLEDTNDSQFFITEGASASLRNLDFHHSIFGVLTEGEDVRAAISDTSIVRPGNTVAPGDRRADRPGVPQVGAETPVEFDITMNNVEIFEDTENAVLFLKASDGATGDVTVTVTVTDEQGNSFDQQFTVTLANDTVNGRPFLDDISSPITVAQNSTAVFQLAATDVEGDAFVFGARRPLMRNPDGSLTEVDQPQFDFTVDPNTGQVEVTPPTDFTGTLQLQVQVAPAGLANPINATDSAVDRQLVTIEVT